MKAKVEMAQVPEKLKDVSLTDLRANPEIVMDLLSGDEDVSVVLQKRGNSVRLGAMKVYSKDVLRIAAEARSEYAQKKRQGYGREDALADLEVFQREITKRTK